MKRKLICTLFALVAGVVSAQEADIKGVRLGMTQQEVSALGVGPSFTIAGVSSRYRSGPTARYEDDKLVRFVMFFKADDFDTLKMGFKSKYPEMKCEEETVTNRMGASFTQEDCRFGALRIKKYASTIENGVIDMTDMAWLRRDMEKARGKAAGDI